MTEKAVINWPKILQDFAKPFDANELVDPENLGPVASREAIVRRLNDAVGPQGWELDIREGQENYVCEISVHGVRKAYTGEDVFDAVRSAAELWGMPVYPPLEAVKPPSPPPPAMPETPPSPPAPPPPPPPAAPKGKSIWTPERIERFKKIKTACRIRDNEQFAPWLTEWSDQKIFRLDGLTEANVDSFAAYMEERYVSRVVK